tara:strand:+ start:1168 stop:2139 length:972 start_codon:yes stop_codon:yes gene_type:complete
MTEIKSLIDLIGNTPLVQVKTFDTGDCNLFLKMENMNPGSSIKDRVALKIIEDAEKSGELNKNSTIVEATAGNTGLGIALIARLKGYKAKVVILDKMNENKVFHLQALGAEVFKARSDVGPDSKEHYVNVAKRICAETPNSYMAGQFTNPSNPSAHELTTGPEIYKQLGGKVDAVVCGVGTGGTISGLGKYFEKKSPHTEMILADPKGSIVKDKVEKNIIKDADYSWLVEGIGEDFIPDTLEIKYIKKAYEISNEEAFKTIKILALNEGILAGSSSGTLISAALKYCKEQKEPKNVVTFVCDNGEKYLNTAYNNIWLKEKNLI